ncbi:hypothetical protein KUTeg_003952 [Tegillarca granosa]|uniref:Vitamin K-dependent gamma-carboxylase n=1 Tax=Tegillarca granosa TaxID=220873 RepID=A0ABQ9FNK0_TEGGR|nr:hypothetical protein KUTeg_003952 [Tegillarca granosa]
MHMFPYGTILYLGHKLLLSDEQIDFFIVHLCGWALDMFGGFLLFFDKTRPYATFFVVQFHLMNSQMFHIGMFPYTMLASTPMFFYADWPKYLLRKLPPFLHSFVPMVTEPQPSVHCIYNKEDIKPENDKDKPGTQSKMKPPTSASRYHKISTIITVLYIAEQCFLPYSHFITQGYNNWTQGLYGYSWDMMAFIGKGASRWASHADMLKQHATCLADRLKNYDINNVEIYFDIWKSVNKRFQQRMFDPRVDIVTAPWSPFEKSSYVMPLLVDLSDWRKKFVEIKKELRNSSKEYEVVFIADFPEWIKWIKMNIIEDHFN